MTSVFPRPYLAERKQQEEKESTQKTCNVYMCMELGARTYGSLYLNVAITGC